MRVEDVGLRGSRRLPARVIFRVSGFKINPAYLGAHRLGTSVLHLHRLVFRSVWGLRLLVWESRLQGLGV